MLSLSATRRVIASHLPPPLKSFVRRAGTRLFQQPTIIEFIAADIVNNCNLRCPFCLVDYDQVKSTNLMTEDTFRALIRLAPAVPTGGFWLSCLHEPTLHPKLGNFIELIPRRQTKKFWFTTNLTRPLPDALIETIAGSGFHHINVSLDSLDEQLFAMLRKHGHLKTFLQNLNRVVAAFRRTRDAPGIRYITMAYRSNMSEIPDMVRWMNEVGHASEVEIRYTYNTANIAEDFRREQFLQPDDWKALRARLGALPYHNYLLCTPPEGYDTQAPSLAANWFDKMPPTAPPHKSFKRPMQLRVRPDGRIHPNGAEGLFAVKVGELEDPIGFLADISYQSSD